jgi:hypothetical protein
VARIIGHHCDDVRETRNTAELGKPVSQTGLGFFLSGVEVEQHLMVDQIVAEPNQLAVLVKFTVRCGQGAPASSLVKFATAATGLSGSDSEHTPTCFSGMLKLDRGGSIEKTGQLARQNGANVP